jgi:hypothetical protein
VEALVEDRISEVPVGQGAGELQCCDHQGKHAERLGACRLRIMRRQASGNVVDDGQYAVGVRLQGCQECPVRPGAGRLAGGAGSRSRRSSMLPRVGTAAAMRHPRDQEEDEPQAHDV